MLLFTRTKPGEDASNIDVDPHAPRPRWHAVHSTRAAGVTAMTSVLHLTAAATVNLTSGGKVSGFSALHAAN